MTLSIAKLCHYAKCHFAGCCILFFVMLRVIMLRVIMLTVVAPFGQELHDKKQWQNNEWNYLKKTSIIFKDIFRPMIFRTMIGWPINIIFYIFLYFYIYDSEKKLEYLLLPSISSRVQHLWILVCCIWVGSCLVCKFWSVCEYMTTIA
jgi:hypothetical protein